MVVRGVFTSGPRDKALPSEPAWVTDWTAGEPKDEQQGRERSCHWHLGRHCGESVFTWTYATQPALGCSQHFSAQTRDLLARSGAREALQDSKLQAFKARVSWFAPIGARHQV